MFNFTINQLNSPFDDSAFFGRNLFRKKAFMFDCGRLGGLKHAEILCIGDIFVTHTHMDHFFGFDRILRGSLVSDHKIHAFGPPGFINNVDGKFRGYTWNLVDEYNFGITAVELSPDGNCKIGEFLAENRFVPKITNYHTDSNVADIGEGFSLEYEFFEHRTLSVGYKMVEPVRYSVDKEKLDAYGYKPGAWLAELKRAIAADELAREITVALSESTIVRRAGELADDLVLTQPRQIITYITDISPTRENVDKAIYFAKDSTLLIIEAVFLEEDKEHAIQKNHLTLPLSKEIFFKSNSEYVRFTHFAARYEQNKGKFMEKLYEGMNGRVFSKSSPDQKEV